MGSAAAQSLRVVTSDYLAFGNSWQKVTGKAPRTRRQSIPNGGNFLICLGFGVSAWVDVKLVGAMQSI
jgi:hypothetical protein